MTGQDAGQAPAAPQAAPQQTPAVAPVAPPATPAPAQPAEPQVDPDIMARLQALRGSEQAQEPPAAAAQTDGSEPQESAGQSPDGSVTDDPWGQPKLPRPKSITERLHRKATRAELEAQQLRERLQQLEQQTQEFTLRQQEQDRKFEELWAKGDVDGALQVKGLGKYADISQRYLQSQGALPPKDPEVERLKQELQQERQARLEREQQEAQRQAQQRQQQEYQQLVRDTQEELSGLGLPGAKELAEVPGFADAVIKVVLQSEENVSLQEAASLVRSNYRGIWEALDKAFGGTRSASVNPTTASQQPVPGGATQVVPPTQPGVQAGNPQRSTAPAVIPQTAAADTTSPRPDETDDQARQRIRAQIEAMMAQGE